MTDETITLYELDACGQWTGSTAEANPMAGWPAGWIYADEAPPPVPTGRAAVWASEAWHVVPIQQPDLSPIRAAALDELADQRWKATQTFTYDEVVAPADPALGAVVGFVVGAQISAPTGPATWKLAPGEFRSWTVADVTAYGIAIRTHIQDCFDQEAALAERVAAATTPAAVAAIVEQARASWPS